MKHAVTFAVLIGCAQPVGDPSESILHQTTTVCGAADGVRGMDVSAYETSIDWEVAKANGIDFAFIRVSDGLQYHDPRFVEYWNGARAAGVMRGAYQFFRPTQDPIAQADYLLSMIGPAQPGDLPPALDVETTGGLPPAEVEAAVRAWIDHVTAAIGRPPIIYAGYYSWQDYTGNANLTSSPLWHAQYTSAPCPNIPTPWTRWTFWQYTAMGTVPEVEGELTDLDIFNGSLEDLRAFADHAPDTCGTVPALGGEIDDTDPCFSAGGPAATLRHVTGAGEGDALIWTHTTASALPGNFAQWSLDLAEAGNYRVEVFTDAAYAQSRHATYHVRAAGSELAVEVDQTAADGWQSLGDLAFAAGASQHLQLDDNTGEPGAAVQLVFDAVRLTRLDPAPPPDPEPIVDDGGCGAARGGGGGACLLILAMVARRRRRTTG